LTSEVCDALGFVIADEFESWPKSPPEGDEFTEKWKQVSEFIRSGSSPYPAEIFFGLRDMWAEEITHSSRASKASRSACVSFLRGGARPSLNVVNANASIKRHVEEEILNEIDEGHERIVLITSGGGRWQIDARVPIGAKTV